MTTDTTITDRPWFIWIPSAMPGHPAPGSTYRPGPFTPNRSGGPEEVMSLSGAVYTTASIYIMYPPGYLEEYTENYY